MPYATEQHAKLHAEIVERMAWIADTESTYAATEAQLRDTEHAVLGLMCRLLDLLASAQKSTP